MPDYSKLRGKIKEKGFSEKKFASLMGIAAATLSSRWRMDISSRIYEKKENRKRSSFPIIS